MAEVRTRDGTWTFDDALVRIVPGHDRKVHKLRKALGELAVPVAAIAGVAFEAGRKGGRLRLRLREGADPFLHVTAGGLVDDADPYRLTVDRDAAGAAEWFVDELRAALDPDLAGPTDRFLLPAPAAPISATAGDGAVSFDGTRVRIEWTEWAEDEKKAAGPTELDVDALQGVEWTPIVGLTNGLLRFLVRGTAPQPPKRDLHAVTWGVVREGGTTSLLAAAVVARLPHPGGPAGPPDDVAPGAAPGDDHDDVLRRLRELGQLHRDAILTDDEFAAAKQALLRRL